MAEKQLTLAALQAKIHAPKKNKNTFGKYNYRSAEDIYEAVKPVLDEFGVDLVLTDEVRYTEGRFYVVATAKLYIGEKEYSAQGWAREQDTKTGMDPAQLTGACSSYARKYALCALFMIDGSDDFDDLDNRNEGATNENPKAPAKTQASQSTKPKTEPPKEEPKTAAKATAKNQDERDANWIAMCDEQRDRNPEIFDKYMTAHNVPDLAEIRTSKERRKLYTELKSTIDFAEKEANNG